MGRKRRGSDAKNRIKEEKKGYLKEDRPGRKEKGRGENCRVLFSFQLSTVSRKEWEGKSGKCSESSG